MLADLGNGKRRQILNGSYGLMFHLQFLKYETLLFGFALHDAGAGADKLLRKLHK